MVSKRLAHFDVIEPIGKGGMGEVYRAEDTRLGREVAIKVLPEAFVKDAERLSRFEREARVLASLNHPNIAAIHEIGEEGETHFLVMELVPGDSLAERLARGPFEPDEAVAVAVQIAEALAAAHERGIVHRDLKPANVHLCPDGRVKVLDFGLAKGGAGTDPSPDPSQSPTLSGLATEAGVLLGTAAYMSPEQARGLAVDRRADVWAFGVVLWEMLTGERLFAGATTSDVLAALLTTSPDPSSLPAAVPERVRRVLRGCLQRDVKSRLRDAGDLALLLRLDEEEVGTGTEAARRTGWWVAAGLLLAATGGALLARWTAPSVAGGNDGPGVSLSILEPTLDPAHSFDLSPDAEELALTVEVEGVPWIALRRLDSFEVRVVEGTEGGFNPFFSPDGAWLGFETRQALHRIRLEGGVAETLFEFEDRVRFDPWDEGSDSSAAWLRDGRIVLSSGHWRFASGYPGLLLISPEGESVELTRLGLETAEYQHMHPEPTPDGRHVIFTNRSRTAPDRVEIVDLADGQRRVLLENAAEGRLVGGRYLLFLRDFFSEVAAARIDPETFEVLGQPKTLFEDPSPYTSTVLRGTRDGLLIYRRGASGGGNQQVLELHRDGAVIPVPVRPGNWMQPRLSKDGSRLLLRELSDACQLWQLDLRREVLSRITDPARDHHDGVWDGSGNRVLTGLQDRDGLHRRLAWIETGGRGRTSFLDVELPNAEGLETHFPSSVSSDGRTVLFTALGPTTDLDVWAVETESGLATEVAVTAAAELGGVFSPDGSWIAYTSDEGGREEIYLVDWPDRRHRLQVSNAGGRAPFWAREGGALFYLQRDRIVEVQLERAEEPLLSRPREVLSHEMGPEGWWVADVFPGGDRFVIVAPTGGGSRELRVLTDVSGRLERLLAGTAP